jgi:hypothetical protein
MHIDFFFIKDEPFDVSGSGRKIYSPVGFIVIVVTKQRCPTKRRCP